MIDIKNKVMEIKIIYIFIMLALIQNAYAIEDKDVRWSEGNSYRVTPTDNMVTEKDYTIKVVDFPSPVRGIRTINGSVPERPVTPFVALELYKDIINNSNPIDRFSLGIGDEYITSDKELKIILNDMPGDMSQDWIYEYYNPWANIKTQKRALPSLDASITLKNGIEEDIEEDNIKPGDKFKIEVKIRNTGEDILKNIDFKVIDTSSSIIPKELKYNIYRLDKDEEKIEKIDAVAPIFLEEKEYEIQVNVTGHDIKETFYNWNVSKIIKVKGDLGLISVNKTIPRSSIYLKENVFVVLSVINRGLLSMNNIMIYDYIPGDLLFLDKGKNINLSKNVNNETEFSFHKNSIGPSDSWTLYYDLKPLEPGIYILPKFKANYSIGGRYFELASEEAGFRVFGPVVALRKSANKKEYEPDIVEVIVNAKNIGNGFTRIIIEDELPKGAMLISGRLNMTTYLDPSTEKIMNYTIKINNIDNIDTNTTIINVTSWPPARATYYLDDYKFNTTSNEKVEEVQIHKTISIEEKKGEEKGEEKGTGMVVTSETPTEVATLPRMDENQKRVVATIPVKTPVQTPEKGVSGFRFYELLFVAILILLGKRVVK